VNDVEFGHDDPDAGQRAVLLARALCTDAPLYGGHPCLSCQAIARRLLARTAGQDLQPVLIGGAGGRAVEAPPHGTNQKASRSHCARLLSTLADQSVLTAPRATGDGDQG